MEQLLEQTFGFSTFRGGQKSVVTNLLAGRSAAAIFPTGSGKSLCYQFTATQLPHLTLVVSPLLALIQDQLAFLHSKGIAAASIDSTLSREQVSQVMDSVRAGQTKVLMISVERLNNERFREFLTTIPVSLLVVDEAHCISEWGHNFRPDYLKLPKYRQQFQIPQTLLLTATATSQVVKDMGEKFAISPNDITLTGFYRANLNLAAQGVPSAKRLDVLLPWLQARQQHSGIVYVTLQKTAEQLAAQLQQQGLNATAYHAGLDHEVRQQIVSQFMQSSGQIIVATIAFGMGIDKSDIRFVAHFDMPKSIENYAQEIGRAGRDGLAADCLVLANRDNLTVLENFVYADTPEASAIAVVLEQIQQAQQQGLSWEVIDNQLSSDANIRVLSLKTLLVYLELLQVVKPLYSFFAEYKYKFLLSEQEILAKFSGERAQFIQAIFTSSNKARLWSTLDFAKLEANYPCERSRVLSALDYLESHGAITLQTKQLTQVYQVTTQPINPEQLTEKLSTKFLQKEHSEIKRIEQLVNFFASERCLSQRLATYFSDDSVKGSCGHCSVCHGQVAQLPAPAALPPLSQWQFSELCLPVVELLQQRKHPVTAVLLTRFLCGLTTPLFTKIKARSQSGFSRLEHYPFAEVRDWVQGHLNTEFTG
ncbi:ATP-dependent DNA helicase RecQ [Psychrobium sp. 1_MG-2023]|uniref:RecQ family ATP-dependent DNA helicase n=1 Tax=Psychrobium sp. 1_MG-2023 TaxID=3062624 RepID=UPI000C33EDA3|nr:RecQ family ATP-dependent DNA helicase [Psychrobium sp. 1_MG-2023]MDP2562398.1 RecQ family ATP-dependent DNA helicase [Psychrobium sp. 1_MG-2023]PKF55839.1 recombinase RecQ [Alteromonadales bacterium alter-6D02]